VRPFVSSSESENWAEKTPYRSPGRGNLGSGVEIIRDLDLRFWRPIDDCEEVETLPGVLAVLGGRVAVVVGLVVLLNARSERGLPQCDGLGSHTHQLHHFENGSLFRVSGEPLNRGGPVWDDQLAQRGLSSRGDQCLCGVHGLAFHEGTGMGPIDTILSIMML